MNDIGKIIGDIASSLPDGPARIWSKDCDEILCDNERVAEAIADLFDSMYGDRVANTGYYDPAEDERNGKPMSVRGIIMCLFEDKIMLL